MGETEYLTSRVELQGDQEVIRKLKVMEGQMRGFSNAANQMGAKSGAFKNFSQTITTMGDSFKNTTKITRNALGEMSVSIEKTTGNFKRFRMEFLSVMFFGMLLQRTFQRLLTSTLNFFVQTSNAQTAQAQALGRLSANWQLLRFAIGDAIATALMPLIPTIIDIIEKVVDWVDQHPKLVSAIIFTGVILGGFLTLLGSVKLGLDGVRTVFKGTFATIAFWVGLAVVAWSLLEKGWKDTPETKDVLSESLSSLAEELSDLVNDIFNTNVEWKNMGDVIRDIAVGLAGLAVVFVNVIRVIVQAGKIFYNVTRLMALGPLAMTSMGDQFRNSIDESFGKIGDIFGSGFGLKTIKDRINDNNNALYNMGQAAEEVTIPMEPLWNTIGWATNDLLPNMNTQVQNSTTGFYDFGQSVTELDESLSPLFGENGAFTQFTKEFEKLDTSIPEFNDDLEDAIDWNDLFAIASNKAARGVERFNRAMNGATGE